jgi:PhnB protein
MKPTMYLNFNGNCAEALDFYARVLGGEVKDVFLNKHASEADRMDAADDAVLNATLIIGGVSLMASDAGTMYQNPQGFSVHLELDSVPDAERVWQALAEGGQTVMPLAEVFWAERFGMLTDRFGTPWMLSHAGAKWQPA